MFVGVWLIGWVAAEWNVGKPIILDIPVKGLQHPRSDLFYCAWLLIWSLLGCLGIVGIFREVFLLAETVEIDSREIRISRRRGGRWKKHIYPLHEVWNFREHEGKRRGGVMYSICFDHNGETIFLTTAQEEPEHLATLQSLQEYLASIHRDYLWYVPGRLFR